jgi:hypothetical protein
MQYGTDDEKDAAHEIEQLMWETTTEIPGSTWEQLTELELPEIFHHRVRAVAQQRQRRAQRFALENAHGVVRTLEDEIRSAAGQYAACIMLDLPFNKTITHTVARATGNLGSNISAFVPKPGSRGLIVGEKEPAHRRMLLIVQTGAWSFEWVGWLRAGEAQQSQYQREFVRSGYVSRPYIVPAEYLSHPREWQ